MRLMHFTQISLRGMDCCSALFMSSACQVPDAALCAGNLQQQAAGAGALQALAYCPARGSAHARVIAKHDAILPLADMLHKGPIPMCCAAAGALCNLALACTDNQVMPLGMRSQTAWWHCPGLAAINGHGVAWRQSAGQKTQQCMLGAPACINNCCRASLI